MCDKMPRYKCHKEVRALKISALEVHEDKSATIIPKDRRYGMFTTEPGWANRWKDRRYGMFTTESGWVNRWKDGVDLGYYVVYDDGYASWSPTKAFEEGYTRVVEEGNDT